MPAWVMDQCLYHKFERPDFHIIFQAEATFARLAKSTGYNSLLDQKNYKKNASVTAITTIAISPKSKKKHVQLCAVADYNNHNTPYSRHFSIRS